jgi:hypothetical protein
MPVHGDAHLDCSCDSTNPKFRWKPPPPGKPRWAPPEKYGRPLSDNCFPQQVGRLGQGPAPCTSARWRCGITWLVFGLHLPVPTPPALQTRDGKRVNWGNVPLSTVYGNGSGWCEADPQLRWAAAAMHCRWVCVSRPSLWHWTDGEEETSEVVYGPSLRCHTCALCSCYCPVDGQSGNLCEPVFEPTCPNQCSGHGDCHIGWCKCHEGW